MIQKTTRTTWDDLSKKSDPAVLTCASCKRPLKSIKLPGNMKLQSVRCNDCFWKKVEELNNPVFVTEKELQDGVDRGGKGETPAKPESQDPL